MPYTRMKRIFLQGLLWLYLLGFGYMALSLNAPEFLDFDNLPDTNFSCVGKVIGGYYADLETNCQMFHVCTIGQLDEPMDIRFLCLNGTVFDQETRVCERIDEVDCAKSERFYSLNLELYGNSQPSLLEESPETEAPLIIKSTAPPTTTTTRTTTTTSRATPKTTRASFYTTVSPTPITTPRAIHHHFPSVNSNSPDIRFNPEEINISLNPGAPPDIRTNPLSFHSGKNSNNNNKVIVNEESQENEQILTHQESDSLRLPLTTQKPKSVVSYGLTHNNNNNNNHHQSVTPSDINFGFTFHQDDQDDQEYQTEPEHNYHYNSNFRPSFQFKPSTYRNDYAPTTLRNRYQPKPTTIRPHYLQLQSLKPPHLHPHHYHQQLRTEKPQRLQLPLPLLPTLSPLTFSSPAPFSLPRHIEIKRYTKDHQEPPRIIISASASVSDNSGRRLNYSLGQIGAAQILDQPPQSYDEYKDSDVGLDPFYHDVPKVKRRNKRSPQKHFDIIKNEQEAVDVLKFLFDWYKSHEQTSTLTIPVSPKVITEINDEFSSATIETPHSPHVEPKIDRTHIESTTTLSTKFSRGRRRYNNRSRGRSRFNDNTQNNTHIEQHDVQTSTTVKQEIIADEIYHEPEVTHEHKDDKSNYHLESVMQEELVTTPKEQTEIVDTVTLPHLRSILNQNQATQPEVQPINYEDYDVPEAPITTTYQTPENPKNIAQQNDDNLNIGEQILNEHKEQISKHLQDDYFNQSTFNQPPQEKLIPEANIPNVEHKEQISTHLQDDYSDQGAFNHPPQKEPIPEANIPNVNTKEAIRNPEINHQENITPSSETQHLAQETTVNIEEKQVHITPKSFRGYSAFNSKLYEAIHLLKDYVGEVKKNITSHKEKVESESISEPIEDVLVENQPEDLEVNIDGGVSEPQENVEEVKEINEEPKEVFHEPVDHIQESIKNDTDKAQYKEITPVMVPKELQEHINNEKPIVERKFRGRKTFKSQLQDTQEQIKEIDFTNLGILPEIAEENLMKEKMAKMEEIINITTTIAPTTITTQESVDNVELAISEPITPITQRSRNSRRRGRPLNQRQNTENNNNNQNNNGRRRRRKKKQSTTPSTIPEVSTSENIPLTHLENQSEFIIEAESNKETNIESTSTKISTKDTKEDFLTLATSSDNIKETKNKGHEEDYVNDNYEPFTYVEPPKEIADETVDKTNATTEHTIKEGEVKPYDYISEYDVVDVKYNLQHHIKDLNTEYNDYNTVNDDYTVNITGINNLFEEVQPTITITSSSTTEIHTTQNPNHIRSRGNTTFAQYLEATNSPIVDTTPTTPLSHLTLEMIATPSASSTSSTLESIPTVSTTESMLTTDTEQYSGADGVKTTGTEERFVVDGLIPENITLGTLDESVKVPIANGTDNNTMVMPLQEYVKDIEESTGSIATSVSTKNTFEKLSDIESTSLLDSTDETSTLEEVNSTTAQYTTIIDTTTEISTTTQPSTILSTTTPPPRSGRRRTFSRNKPSYSRHRFSTPNVTQRTALKETTLDILESLKSKTNAYEATIESTSPKNVPIKNLDTDAPLYKSASPTEAKKIHSSTLSMVQKKLIFNCFDKDLNHFYPDARDCRLFHYCTNGFNKNQLLDMKFVCDLNTFFDSEKLICTKLKPKRCL
ncbi:unnamed protein product [Brassicogethes aeneus]|uniref:Chitin-binding type-2 domain-containing protein n=1 Tax=Brassicogethes aeneus TaxID=1431903 RepID=A0A9P0B6A3_BRAAE|nr:unnamed protein product [Brassicogethes aeneus]